MNSPLEIPLIKIPNRKGDIIIVNNPLFAFIYVTVYSRNVLSMEMIGNFCS